MFCLLCVIRFGVVVVYLSVVSCVCVWAGVSVVVVVRFMCLLWYLWCGCVVLRVCFSCFCVLFWCAWCWYFVVGVGCLLLLCVVSCCVILLLPFWWMYVLCLLVCACSSRV